MRLPLCLGLTLRISLCYSPSALSRNTYCTFLVKSPYLRVSLDSAYLVMWSFSLYTCALHDCRTRAPLRTSRACVNRRSIKENCTLNYISKATGRTEPILLQRVLISPSKKKKTIFCETVTYANVPCHWGRRYSLGNARAELMLYLSLDFIYSARATDCFKGAWVSEKVRTEYVCLVQTCIYTQICFSISLTNFNKDMWGHTYDPF